MKRKRWFLGAAAAFMLLVAGTGFSYAGQVGVTMDGGGVAFSPATGYPFVDQNNRTMVPLRVTMETFGANVIWDAETKTATVEKDGVAVKVTVGRSYVVRNGQQIPNDTAAVVSNGRTYLPIRSVLECFGAVVSYDSTQRKVVVDSQCSAAYATNLLYSGSAVRNFWPTYNNANAQRDAGSYAAAIPGYEASVPSFAADGSSENLAVLYEHLGDCLAKTYYYDKAVSCYRKAADYWTAIGKDQESISLDRKADLIRSELSLYTKTSDKSRSLVKYYGLPGEPQSGILLGAYAEGDPGVHDPSSGISGTFYMDEFPVLTGKDHGAYLLYLDYGMPLSHYDSHIKAAKERGKAIELALQPRGGLDAVNGTDGYLEQLASDMEASGVRFYLRFANEMNDTTSPWYTTDCGKYIDKFRTVSTIFKKNAPSVAIVWAPNFFPPDTIPNYYPGDDFVDFVGISCYQNYDETLDPLGQSVDRGRWSTVLDRVYSLYADRKPIIVAEGGCSYIDRVTGKDITDYSAYQVRDFYTYLPIRYPNVKAVFYYDAGHGDGTSYILSQNQTVLNAYKTGISGDHYRSETDGGSAVNSYYVPICSASTLPAADQELNAFAKFADSRQIASVQYMINGQVLGTANSAPYAVRCDLSAYAGQTITIQAAAYGTKGNPLVSREFHVKVE